MEAEGGLRRAPEIDQPAERPRSAQQPEFDWWADGADDDGTEQGFARRAQRLARQASLDPDDGVAL